MIGTKLKIYCNLDEAHFLALKAVTNNCSFSLIKQ